MPVAPKITTFMIVSRYHECAYQSECGDHRLHERHWVSVHWCRHAGQTPPVSKVFHSLPQVQNHLSSLRGDQPHSGQRMRGGSDALGFFSSSSSRSGTMTGLSVTGLMPAPTEPRSQHAASDVRLAISAMTSEGMNCPRSCYYLAAVRHTARNQSFLTSLDGDALSINQQCVASLHNQHVLIKFM